MLYWSCTTFQLNSLHFVCKYQPNTWPICFYKSNCVDSVSWLDFNLGNYILLSISYLLTPISVDGCVQPVIFQAVLDSIFGVQLSSVTWKYLHFEFCGNPLNYFLSWHTVHIETFREGMYFCVSLYYNLNYNYIRENMSIFSS